jgi:hypothetical protein
MPVVLLNEARDSPWQRSIKDNARSPALGEPGSDARTILCELRKVPALPLCRLKKFRDKRAML